MAPLEVKTGMIRMTNIITYKTKYLIQHTDEKIYNTKHNITRRSSKNCYNKHLLPQKLENCKIADINTNH